MNINDLKKNLKKANIKNSAYTLHGGLPHDKHVLNLSANGLWEVYYSERGGKFEERVFESEDEACRFFLNRILSDSTAKL